ncbi:MAG: CocE/NonD family hydrolase [Acidobacteriota bacterium]
MIRKLLSFTLVALLITSAYSQRKVQFGKCDDVPQRSEVSLQAIHIPVRDGVKIAADVILPKDLPAGKKLPTILLATRYWRAVEGTPAGNRFWTDHGYAVVAIDVRGTGASFGRWPHPWSADEIKDLGDVIKWIVAQAWSDGNVGSIGTSYTANTAEFTAVSNHPAIKAVVPRFSDFDLYTDLTFPGGLFNEFLAREWGAVVASLDKNVKQGQPPRGVRPVDEDKDGSLLAAALSDHEQNPSVYEASKQIVYRDDKPAGWNAEMKDFSAYNYRREIERSRVPIFAWASWMDAGTANGAIKRFLTFSNPQRLIIGAWSHGGGFHASQFLPPATPTDPNQQAQSQEAVCFLDQFLKGKPNGMNEKIMFYYTMGEERWKSTRVWPPAGSVRQRWYLAADNSLARTSPKAGTGGADKYTVDFQATTGRQNRWYTQLGGGDVIYGDRAEADRRLLTYTSAPLEEDMEITGHPVVTLFVASTAEDGAFIVYLEDVDEQGRVTYITEGQLRAIHRKLSTETPPYRMLEPYHSFKRKDSMPVKPGEVMRLTFGILPTSVLIKKGHRIRIAIAGADKDTFARLPADKTPTIIVERNIGFASFIDLPVIRNFRAMQMGE